MKISNKIFEQFEQIRVSGICNMFDAGCVLKTAYDRGLYEFVNFIVKSNGRPDTKKYTKILEGYEKWKK